MKNLYWMDCEDKWSISAIIPNMIELKMISEILLVEQIWIIIRTSKVIATQSCIILTRSIGKRFLQLVILNIANLIICMPKRTFPSTCMCKTRAQMNLEAMMVTSFSFFVISIYAADSGYCFVIINASDICRMNMRMQFFRMESSSACPTLIGCPGFLGSSNTINLYSGSLIRRSRSRGALCTC